MLSLPATGSTASSAAVPLSLDTAPSTNPPPGPPGRPGPRFFLVGDKAAVTRLTNRELDTYFLTKSTCPHSPSPCTLFRSTCIASSSPSGSAGTSVPAELADDRVAGVAPKKKYFSPHRVAIPGWGRCRPAAASTPGRLLIEMLDEPPDGCLVGLIEASPTKTIFSVEELVDNPSRGAPAKRGDCLPLSHRAMWSRRILYS